jgi:hypothetical protein
MDATLLQMGAILLGILLRLAIPLLLTLLLAWLLRRLDAHWQKEAAAERRVAERRVTERQVAERRPAAHRIATETLRPCWQICQCAPEQRRSCPAFTHPDQSCWDHFRTNSALPEKCLTCQVWQSRSPGLALPAPAAR